MSPSLQARFNDLAKLESQAAASAARASAACIMPPPQPELQQHHQQQQQQQQHQLVSAFEHPTRSASSEDSIVLSGRANMDTENQWSLSLTRYNSFLDETHSQSKAEGRASFHKLRSASDRFKDEVSGWAKARGVLPVKVLRDRPCPAMCRHAAMKRAGLQPSTLRLPFL